MTEADELSADQQMLYWTGAVSRADVLLEHQLNQIFATMTMAFASALAPSGLMQHVNLIRRLLDEDYVLAEDVRDAIRSALQETKSAHEERNRLVHDLWWNDLQPESDPERFVRGHMFGKRSPGPDVRKLEDFKACHRRLNTCLFRLVSAGMLLSGYYFKIIGQQRPDPWGPDVAATNLQIAAGHLSLNEDGSFTVT